MSNPDSNINKYQIGNTATLDVPGVRDALIEFHKKWYSSDIMGLCITTNDTLDNMQAKVEEYFTGIENKNLGPISYKNDPFPFSPERLGKVLEIVPIGGKHSLRMSWMLPEISKEWRSKSGHYMSHLIAHESLGAVLPFLIKEGLAEALTGYCDNSLDYYSTMNLIISLTTKGLEEWEKIVDVVFQYVNMLKEKGAQQWIHDELERMLALEWEFQAKRGAGSSCIAHSISLRTVPVQDVLKHNYIMDNYNPGLLNKIFNSLTPDRAIVALISPTFDGKTSEVEPFYTAKYNIKDFTPEQKARFTNPDLSWATSGMTAKDLDLPAVNPFVPKNFDVLWKGKKDMNTTPKTLREDDKVDFYFMQDKQFLLPKAHMCIKVHCDSENYYHDKKTYAMAQLWVKGLNDFIQDYGYHADLASCEYRIETHTMGIEITVSGYSDTFPKFLTWFYGQLEAFQSHFDEQRWTNMHANTLRNVQNARTSEPYSLGLDLVDASLMGGHTTIEQAIWGFENIDWEMYKSFKSRWMKNIRIEGLLEGNVLEETGLQWCSEIVDNFDRIYKPTWMSRDDMNQHRIVQLPKQTNWIVNKELTMETEGNCAYLSYWEMGQGMAESTVPALLIDNLLTSKAFEQLRTQEQLGYVVWFITRMKKDVNYGIFILQSDVKEPNYIHGRVVEFLDAMKKMMDELTEEEFAKVKTAVSNTYLEKFKSIPQRCNNHWAQVCRQDYIWNYKEVILEQIANCSLAKVKEVFNKTFFGDRKVLEVHINNVKMREESRKLREERAEKDSSVKLASNAKSFMRRMPMYADNWSHRK